MPLGLGIGISPVLGGGGGGLLSPSALFVGRSSGGWWTAYDNTYLTVNNDGTGGLVASDGTVGRWDDRSGFGNHLPRFAVSNEPIYRTGQGLNFPWATNGSVRQGRLKNSSTTSFQSDSFSGGIVYNAAVNETNAIDFGGSNFNVINGLSGVNASHVAWYDITSGGTKKGTGLFHTCRKNVVTWRSNGTNAVFHVNGVEAVVAKADASVAMTRISMGMFDGGAPKPMQAFEAIVYDYDIGAGNQTALDAYLRANAGSYDNTRSVAIYGDSLSMGVGSETYKPWPTYITNRPNSRWHNLGWDGGFIFAPHITAANFALLKGSNEGIAVIWIGTNDIRTGGQSGLTTAANIKAYSDTLRTAGMKVVVCTLQAFALNNAERLACNAQIATDTSHYDAIADLAADAALGDSTNPTYYTSDGVHLMDAGYVAAAARIQTAMASV